MLTAATARADESEGARTTGPPSTPHRTIVDLIEGSAQFADRLAVVMEPDTITFGAADRLSARLAGRLLAAGMGKGSRVGILFPNDPRFLVAFLAVTRIGAIAVPISTFVTAPELARVCRHADIQLLITVDRHLKHDYLDVIEEGLLRASDRPGFPALSAPYLREVWVWGDCEGRDWARRIAPAADSDGDAELLRAVQSQVVAADPAVIVYTSGSTAAPKGVIHTHGAVTRQAHKQAWQMGFQHGEVIFGSLPFFWVGGLTVTLLPAFVRACTVVAARGSDPGSVLDVLEKYRVSYFMGWPHTVDQIVHEPSFAKRDLSSVRAGNLRVALPQERENLDPSLKITTLGMTETAGPHTIGHMSFAPDRLRGTVGVPAPGMQHRLVDPETGDDVPEGEVGELLVRGDTLCVGMHRREASEVFDVDGWLHTRDLCSFREGNLFFHGRLDDLAKVRGFSIAPTEVEAALLTIDGVASAFVSEVRLPDSPAQLGAAVTVVPGSTLTAEDIRVLARERLSSYKVPSVVRVLSLAEVPVTASSKVDRRRLREMLHEVRE